MKALAFPISWLLWSLALFATAVASDARAADPAPYQFVRDIVVGDTEQWMEIATTTPAAIRVEIRKSHRPNDVNCRETEGGVSTDIAPTGKRILFAFARQTEPGIALYEWHVCFVIGDTTYRAWHGYDPGPGARLHAHCVIDAGQIAAKTVRKTCARMLMSLSIPRTTRNIP